MLIKFDFFMQEALWEVENLICVHNKIWKIAFVNSIKYNMAICKLFDKFLSLFLKNSKCYLNKGVAKIYLHRCSKFLN